MIIYLTSFAIMLIITYIADKRIKNKALKVFLYVLGTIPLILVSSLRVDVGFDYNKRYVHDYNAIKDGNLKDSLEIGFKLIIKFCLIFTDNPRILFVITSCLILGLIFASIYINSENKVLSIFLFFAGGFFFGSLNLVRQYLAMSLILFGSGFLLKEKKRYILIYLIFLGLAILIHTSSIVGIILVLFRKRKILNWKFVIPVRNTDFCIP